MSKKIMNAVDLAVRIMRERPELKYYQAIELAKEVLKDENKDSSIRRNREGI